MKLTNVLFQQHVGKMFRRHWKVQGKKVIYENGSLKAVKEKGLQFENAVDFIKEKPVERDIEGVLKSLGGYRPNEVLFDETHPDFHDSSCLVYGDHSVLLEGLRQAQVLTNSILISPDSLPINKEVLLGQELAIQDKLVKRCIRSSLLYDATQKILPKRHDPLREAWIFPRDYGIPDKRRNYLLGKRLLQLCSSLSPQLLGQRSLINSAKFVLPLTLSSGQKILFSVTGDAVILASESPCAAFEELPKQQLPDIFPLEPTVSLESTNIYKFDPSFPVSENSKLSKIHTVLIHYNETQVANIFETPVTVEQILGRSLMQSWIIAMSQAKKDNDREQVPVTIQAVQTDGKFFHFSVFQLSSTSLDSSAPSNYFCSFPVMNIFDSCSYVQGVPVLEGYNSEIFKTLLAFYNNS